MDSCGSFTGPDIAWVFPDRVTALLGRFEAGRLVEARPATVRDCRLDRAGVLRLDLRPISAGPAVRFSPATATSLGDQPTLRDCYEDRTVSTSK